MAMGGYQQGDVGMSQIDRRTVLKATGVAALAGAAATATAAASATAARAGIGMPDVTGAMDCANEHARLSRGLARKLALGSNSRSAHLIKTAHCSHCNTRIGADYIAVQVRA